MTITKDQVDAAVLAAAKSIKVTAAAIVGAIIISAGVAGSLGSPEQFWLFVKSQWFTITMVQVIAPSIRGYAAAKGVSRGTNSTG